jgi:amidase
MDSIPFAPAHRLAGAIRTREASAVEVLEAHLGRIGKYNGALNAIVTLDADGARASAAAADAAVARGDAVGPLHGVPVVLKDGHETAGMRTVVGMARHAGHVPADDGAVAARLRAAGAIILGKTNVPPRLRDVQADNPVFGRTNNPWALDRTPGGSSGGAAAAVAAGLAPLDIGSDLGGSIRFPAHLCGVYGFKPTERAVSLAGHLADPPGMTRNFRIMFCHGPIARDVDDLELALRIIAGPDDRDPEVPPRPLREPGEVRLDTLRIAYAPSFPGSPVAAEIAAAVEAFAASLSGTVARLEAALPAIDFAAERQLFSDIADGLSFAIYPPKPGREPLTLGAYLDLLDRRDAVIAAWERFFDDWDVLLCPPAMTTAFTHRKMGEPVMVDGVERPYWSLLDYTCPFNLTGHPAGVMPLGFDGGGLPIGVQVVGRRWQDLRLLRLMALLAARTDGFVRPPGYG